MWRTPRKSKRWPHYIMRPHINSCIDLTFCICLYVTRSVIFHRWNARTSVEKKCQLAPIRQYISTMEWIVYFSREWSVDFSAIFLLWDRHFLVCRTNNSTSLSHILSIQSVLCLLCFSSCLLCSNTVWFCPQFLSELCLFFLIMLSFMSALRVLSSHVKLADMQKGGHSHSLTACLLACLLARSLPLSLNLLFLCQCI